MNKNEIGLAALLILALCAVDLMADHAKTGVHNKTNTGHDQQAVKQVKQSQNIKKNASAAQKKTSPRQIARTTSKNGRQKTNIKNGQAKQGPKKRTPNQTARSRAALRRQLPKQA